MTPVLQDGVGVAVGMTGAVAVGCEVGVCVKTMGVVVTMGVGVAVAMGAMGVCVGAMGVTVGTGTGCGRISHHSISANATMTTAVSAHLMRIQWPGTARSPAYCKTIGAS